MSKEKFDQRFNEAWNMQPPYVAHQRSRGDVRLVPNVEVASPAEPPEQGEKLYPAWVVSTLREKLRSLSYGPEQGQPFNQPEPPYEFKVPTEETFRIRAFVYDAITKQSTMQEVGVLHVPIDPDQFTPPAPDDHPPLRSCDCVDCTEYYADKDLAPRDHEFYETEKSPLEQVIPEWDETHANAAVRMLFYGSETEKEGARAYLTHYLIIGQ